VTVHPEITPAAGLLLLLLFALLVHDFADRKRRGRLLFVQLAVFLGGGTLIVFPDVATRLAHLVGIGRGVDFVLYPLVIWLVRESLLSRRRRREEEERLTELVRSLAAERARVVSPE
jgi:small membrane protein